jgi:phosphoribosylformylglycinamidine synthase I
MKVGVVTFPGSNCDHDMLYVLRHILQLETVGLWHKEHDLQGVDMVILPGGFSYGDYLRSGSIARFSPIMTEVIAFANKGGYVLGICNGFQVLTESHLLPGALIHNTSHRFICKNVCLKPETKNSAITADLELDKAYKIPVAHGEGRFFAPPEVLEQLNANEQVLFRYSDKNGLVSDAANPNGSIENIAGICNENRNVIGMMPHPERAADINLGNTDGLVLFKSLFNNFVLA